MVWIPDPTTRDLRALIKDPTMVKIGLDAIALNQRLALGPWLWSRHSLAQLHALTLCPTRAPVAMTALELSALAARVPREPAPARDADSPLPTPLPHYRLGGRIVCAARSSIAG